MADELNVEFWSHFPRTNRLVAQVPSARETIDVAVSSKGRIGRDYVNRTLDDPANLMFIGDSLQEGGNDYRFYQELPEAICIHVGYEPAGPGVWSSCDKGPDGVLESVQLVLDSMNGE